MKVYVVTATYFSHVTVHGVYWRHATAAAMAHRLVQREMLNHQTAMLQGPEYRIHPVEIEPLNWLVSAYSRFRGYKEPSPQESFIFLTSEIGELGDAVVHHSATWVDNNPVAKAQLSIPEEIADVLMMLTKLADNFGIDPITAMIEKFKSKGFEHD